MSSASGRVIGWLAGSASRQIRSACTAHLLLWFTIVTAAVINVTTTTTTTASVLYLKCRVINVKFKQTVGVDDFRVVYGRLQLSVFQWWLAQQHMCFSPTHWLDTRTICTMKKERWSGDIKTTSHWHSPVSHAGNQIKSRSVARANLMPSVLHNTISGIIQLDKSVPEKWSAAALAQLSVTFNCWSD